MNSRDVSKILIVIVIVSTFSFALTILPESARAATHYVGGVGPGNYTTIQSAIDAAFPGDTVYVYNGTYVENVVVYKTLNLTGEDRNTTIIDANRSGDAILVTADWVNVTGFTAMMTGFATSDSGIMLDSVQNCYIANNNPSHTNWNSIYLRYSNNNTITNNVNFSDNMYGIRLFHSHYNTITYNNASFTYGYGLRVRFSDNNTISHNNFSDNDNGIEVFLSFNNTISNNTISKFGKGIDLTYSSRNRITGNILYHNYGWGIIVYQSDNNIIDNNIAFSNNWYAIYLRESRGVIITDNAFREDGIFIRGNLVEHWNTHVIDISNTANGKPIYYWKNVTGGTVPSAAGQVILANCTNVTVENQNISDTAAGVLLGFSSYNMIANNTMWENWHSGYFYRSDNNTFVNNSGTEIYYSIVSYYSHNNTYEENSFSSRYGVGIDFDRSHNNTIHNNTFFENAEGSGIRLIRAFNNTVTNNMAYSNYYDGISVGYSCNNTIVNNTFSSNRLDGISLGYSSNNNTIIGNLVSINKATGISIASSVDNMVYHNNIINNTEQAYDDSDANQWDNGYPSGGNYWDDYNGTDDMNGPNQDIPGSDGIGDTPYNITGGPNQDRYPLMSPLIPMPTLPSEPQNLQAIGGGQQVSLSWDQPASTGGSPVINYRIYRGNASGGETFLVEVGNMLSYVDGGLTAGQTYYYQVSAVNFAGEGPLSNEANATLKAPPGSPDMISANLTGFWYEDVTITWALSSDDGAGQNSVVGYEIYRNTTFDPNGLGYGLLTSLPNGTASYTDMWAGEPDMANYFYRTCALDNIGIRSCSQTQAAKFTRYIVRGLNLVSFPLIPSDGDVNVVLQTVHHDIHWLYDSPNHTWKSSVKSKPYSQGLGSMNNTMGMWVNVTTNSNFTVAGIVPTETTIYLKAGWNLIGFPSFNSTYSLVDLKAQTGATRVEGYDASAPPYFLRKLQDSDTLQAGQGYWVYLTQDTTWTLTNT